MIFFMRLTLIILKEIINLNNMNLLFQLFFIYYFIIFILLSRLDFLILLLLIHIRIFFTTLFLKFIEVNDF